MWGTESERIEIDKEIEVLRFNNNNKHNHIAMVAAAATMAIEFNVISFYIDIYQ